MNNDKAENVVDDATSFDDFNLHPQVAEAIKKIGFEKPTSVQTRTYEGIMEGGDLIAMAQTGTGKTAAFGIPIVQKIDPEKKAVQSLVLAPTRELALQVCREIRAIGKIRGIGCAAVYGGASFGKQVTEVKEGAQVIAGTPGRVLDHIRRGTISFSGLEMLVLDEADEMLSMGFEKEISEIIEALPRERQNLLFSATIPDDIRRLTVRYMGEAKVVSVSGDNIAAKDVSHFVYLVSGQGRPKDMARIIENEQPKSALVFCNTREETQTLARYLKNQGYNAEWLNSDLSQKERESVMQRTRDEKIQYLVATDVAARGIDVSHLSHVINYTFPESLEVYVHRTGRTGRMGKEGKAVSLIAPKDIGNLYYLRLTYNIHPVEKTLEDTVSTAREMELDRLRVVRKAFSGTIDPQNSNLARRIVQDVHAERIIAGLLAKYFAALQPAPKESVPKNAVKPVALKDDKKTEKREASKISEAPKRNDAPKKKAKKKKTKSGPSDKPSPKTAPETMENEIYIDAGRKDGMRISFLMKEIARLADLPRAALGKVRLLTRSTFVAVPQEHFDAVLKTIKQIELDGRRLKAEPAN